MDPSIADLQAQIDRLSRAYREWREEQGYVRPVEERLAALGDRGTEILNRWEETDRRYARAVHEIETKLDDWGGFESRLQQQSTERLRAFEDTIQREWESLRQMHEEPLKQLQEQAVSLGETCVAAANLTLRGYERAETRLASLEADLRGQLGLLSREVHSALADVRRDAGRSIGAGAAPFPLESVMKIHDEQRDADESGRARRTELGARVASARPAQAPRAEALPVERTEAARPVFQPVRPAEPVPPRARGGPAAATLPEAPTLFSRSGRWSEPASANKGPEWSSPPPEERRRWPLAAALVVVAVFVLGFLFTRTSGESGVDPGTSAPTVSPPSGQRVPDPSEPGVSEGLPRMPAAADAEPLPEPATEPPTPAVPLAAGRAEPPTPALPSAPDPVALLAREVVTAADSVRFNVDGVGQASGAAGRIIWSRASGLVLEASGVPRAGQDSTYAVWLLTDDVPVRVGTFEPDDSGTARLVTTNPPGLPVVHSVTVTVEPADGAGSRPSGVLALVRVLR